MNEGAAPGDHKARLDALQRDIDELVVKLQEIKENSNLSEEQKTQIAGARQIENWRKHRTLIASTSVGDLAEMFKKATEKMQASRG